MTRYCEIYQVKQLPILQNVVYSTRNEAVNCAKGDVTLVQDLETGLIFNRDFDPGLLEYGPEYQNEQSWSPTFRQHLDTVATIIMKHFWGSSMMEIGCGKGYFLEQLQKKGFYITGIDPAYEGNNPDIVKKAFDSTLGLTAEGIILRHVLEHIPNPIHFLELIRDANKGKGKIYIEVPSFEWICNHKAWFDIYYEHVNYFCLHDFIRMFDIIYESGSFFGGQYLYVIADLASLRTPVLNENCLINLPNDFLSRIKKFNEIINHSPNRSSIIWGGSSKGVIFSILMGRSGANIDFTIDINPVKQRKYIAGSGLYIHSAEEGLSILKPGDNVFIVNSEYLREIVAQSRNQFNYLLVDHE